MAINLGVEGCNWKKKWGSKLKINHIDEVIYLAVIVYSIIFARSGAIHLLEFNKFFEYIKLIQGCIFKISIWGI